jgi:hypothetical protein
VVQQTTRTCTVCITHLAEFVVVVSLGKKELERLLTSLNGSPCQGRVPLGVRIRVTHVGALYEPFYEEKVVFYQMRNNGFQSGG